MRPSSINSPQHWRESAEEIRTLVADVKDEFAKQKMLQIAEDYERLAKQESKSEHIAGLTRFFARLWSDANFPPAKTRSHERYAPNGNG